MSTIATSDTFIGTAATSAFIVCVVLTMVTLVMLMIIWRRR